MKQFCATYLGLAIAGSMVLLAVASPAKADWDDHGWREHHWPGPRWGWGPPAYYYSPPVVYASPPVYYAPPPPPVYYAPGVSLGVTIR